MMPTPAAAALPSAAPRTAAKIPWGFAEWFAISQTALPAILMFPDTQAFRLPIRASAFAISLGAFVWWALSPGPKLRQARAQSWVVAIMALLVLMMFHPLTASWKAGLAQLTVYFAVMVPIFWAPRFVRSPEQLGRIMWILLVCAGVNSVVGVLQVYNPDRWLPAEFSRVMTDSGGLGPVTFIGPNGKAMVRPPGLFDTPGSVAGPATYAALLGLVFAVSRVRPWQRLLSLAFAGAGLATIYLTQVRISWAVTLGMMLAYGLTLSRQGRLGRASQFAILAGGIFVGGFLLAASLGGQAIVDRFVTLFASDPWTVYHGARGFEFDLTFSRLIVDYPLGGGLGRWGMAAALFGTFTRDHPSMWAEIQLSGWTIDGGLPMLALYGGALVVVTLSQWRIAMMSNYSRLATCGAVVLAANLGTAAMIFSFTPFVAQMGIQYWFLAGALHGVALNYGTDGA